MLYGRVISEMLFQSDFPTVQTDLSLHIGLWKCYSFSNMSLSIPFSVGTDGVCLQKRRDSFYVNAFLSLSECMYVFGLVALTAKFDLAIKLNTFRTPREYTRHDRYCLRFRSGFSVGMRRMQLVLCHKGTSIFGGKVSEYLRASGRGKTRLVWRNTNKGRAQLTKLSRNRSKTTFAKFKQIHRKVRLTSSIIFAAAFVKSLH